VFLIRCSDRYFLDFFDLCLWLSNVKKMKNQNFL
jgi:hypothetical protein